MWGYFLILAIGWFELRLLTQRKHIMSVISDFAARVADKFASIDSSVSGINSDIVWLKTKIDQLQNSTGEISAEDQALLNAIEARIGGLATKVEELNAVTEVTPTPDAPSNPVE